MCEYLFYLLKHHVISVKSLISSCAHAQKTIYTVGDFMRFLRAVCNIPFQFASLNFSLEHISYGACDVSLKASFGTLSIKIGSS